MIKGRLAISVDGMSAMSSVLSKHVLLSTEHHYILIREKKTYWHSRLQLCLFYVEEAIEFSKIKKKKKQ